MEENSGLSVEMNKRLLKKPDATVDAVLKVRSTVLKTDQTTLSRSPYFCFIDYVYKKNFFFMISSYKFL